MDRNFKACLAEVLKHEGGWADNPKDPGGATMKGVTLANFRKYVKPNATKEDLRKITNAQIQTVYRRFYWDAVNGAELPDGIDMAVFDFAVNSGPSRAAQYLQKVVGVNQDGKIGPATIKSSRDMLPAAVISRLCDERLAFMKRAKGSAGASKGKLLWPTFGKGWQKRVDAVRSFSLKLSAQPTPEKPTVVTETVEVPVPVEKPVVPKSVETEVRQKTNWLSGIFGAGGLFGGLSAWMAGMDKDALILTLGVAFVVIIAFIVAGEWIIRRIKAIRQEIET